MKDMLQGKRFLGAVGMSVVLTLVICATAFGQQQIQVSGKVTAPDGEKIRGASVRIRGTTTSAVTDDEGKYSLTAPSDAVLVFNRIGYRGVGLSVGGRATIDVVMERAVTVLPEVVVTGYTTQRRADITGAVATVDVAGISQQTSTSVLQRLDGQVSGVTVEAGGSPGSRTTVRIRGVSSFQNNDPLYIVDGTPVQDTYLNWLNPSEIGSIQVLKDASAASIYGSRASNGVVIIETRRGRPGPRRISLDVRTGVATPTHGMDDILTLNALDYFKVVKTAYENAGTAVPRNIYGDPNNPSVPAYIWPNDGKGQSCSAAGPTCTTVVDPTTYKYPSTLIMPGSPGTNWWKAVFGSGQYRDANLAVSGGGEDNAYHVSFNYLDQEGTAAFNRLQRGGVRINTAFNMGRTSVGENITASRDRSYGGLDDAALGGKNIIGQNIMQQPGGPGYHINGDFASGEAGRPPHPTNPPQLSSAAPDHNSTDDRIFGNVFAGFDAAHDLSLKTRLGLNLGHNSFHGFSPTTPENSQVTDVNGINENYNVFTDGTWSNTLNYTPLRTQP